MSSYLRQSVALDFGRQADPDILYYNVNIQSLNTLDTTPRFDPQIVFQETRSAPLLEDAEDFQFSIVRFALNGANRSLPLWMPRIQSQAIGPLGEISISGGPPGSPGQPPFFPSLNAPPLRCIPDVFAGDWLQVLNQCLPPQLEAKNIGGATQQLRIQYKPQFDNPFGFRLQITGALATALGYTVGNAPFTGVAPFHDALNPTAVLGDPNLTIYQIRVSVKDPSSNIVYYSGGGPNNVVGFLNWTPENVNTPAPGPVTNKQDMSTDYYYAYSYDKFVEMFNAALAAAVADAWQVWKTATVVPPNPIPALPAGLVPFIKYNSTTRLFELYAPSNNWGDDAELTPNTNGQWQLFMNTNLEGLITGFNTNFIQNNPPGLTNQLQIYDTSEGYKENLVTINSATFWKMTQNYPSTGSIWNPCDSIVFTSSYIPVAKEAVGTPNVFATNNIGYTNPTNPSAFQSIVSDITIDTSSGAEAARNFILYNPTAEYRMCDMSRANTEIRNLDLQVWWRNRYDNSLYPLRLTNGSSASLKLMFRRRGAAV